MAKCLRVLIWPAKDPWSKTLPNSILHEINVLASVATSSLAIWRGTNVVLQAQQPPMPIKLYDIESSPPCRAVREALTALGLDVEIYPCPKGGKRFRREAERLAGKQQFPLLIDTNTGTLLNEPAAIIEYLYQTYAGGIAAPKSRVPAAISAKLNLASSLVRVLHGTRYQRAKPPEQLLELWSFESSPFSRLVRERLTELELPYLLHNIGKEQLADMGPAAMRLRPGPYRPKAGGRREKVLAQFGRVQAPYLEDPNTGAKLYESAKIIDYLDSEYAL